MPNCELTQPVLSHFTAVRASINTAQSAGVMKPLCGDGDHDCSACESAGLDVTFDTRSYLLAGHDQQCAGMPFGHPTATDYECVDYQAGALHLAGLGCGGLGQGRRVELGPAGLLLCGDAAEEEKRTSASGRPSGRWEPSGLKTQRARRWMSSAASSG